MRKWLRLDEALDLGTRLGLTDSRSREIIRGALQTGAQHAIAAVLSRYVEAPYKGLGDIINADLPPDFWHEAEIVWENDRALSRRREATVFDWTPREWVYQDAHGIRLREDELIRLLPTSVNGKPPGIPAMRRPARPTGTGYQASDAPLIDEMRELLTSGRASSATAAASVVAHRAKGASPDAKVRRLVGRYRDRY